MDGVINGTPDDEVDAIIQSRINDIIKEAETNETINESNRIQRNS